MLPDLTPGVYAPSGGAKGYLLFVRGSTSAPGAVGTLMARPFDLQRLALTGDAFPVAENVPNMGFSASSTNALAYSQASKQPQG